MSEYNELTKKLLTEGYTADNYPKYVQLDKVIGKSALDNWDGGFTYKRWWIYERTFKTPCGLQCKGLSCMTSLCYEGIEHTYENDNALVECPYGKKDCEHINGKLRSLPLRCNCQVHMVDEEYIYNGSVEGIQKLHDDEIQREKISFIMQRKGRVCENQMHYDKDKKEWLFHYNPGTCANMNCVDCPVLGKPLDKKKGNVYYDIKQSGRRYDLDGTLFEGQTYTTIFKDKRVFKRPVSMDICRIYLKLCKDEVIKKVKSKYHSELFFAKRYGREFSVDVLNIRAEAKPSRDLLQDLEDIKAGANISHESDTVKHIKESKSTKRKEAQEKRIQKLEKKILDVGYENLTSTSLDKKHADKWIPEERLQELDSIREKKLKEEKNKPVQMNLSDFLTG